ncbi:8-oxo-dGTP diphosphatase [Lachnospiraceae bacterium]|nr:8-oxo-dGTP diphosphatase [Lachnospiraceae bacterium]
MKTVKVVCAVIEKNGKIFATQRGYGEFKDGWEFPGGKIEDGETPEEAIVREIKEELNTDIEVRKYIATSEHDYPMFHISMQCFLCSIKNGSLELLEHEAAKWVSVNELRTVDWLPADEILIDDIAEMVMFLCSEK